MRGFIRTNGRGHGRAEHHARGNARRQPGAGHVDGRGHAHSSRRSSGSVASISNQNSGDNNRGIKSLSEDKKRYGLDRPMLLTNEDILFFGLTYVGFDDKRQKVRNTLNVDRFKAHFGAEPRTIKDLLNDLKEEFTSDLIYRDVMMTLNWLKICKFRTATVRFICYFQKLKLNLN